MKTTKDLFQYLFNKILVYEPNERKVIVHWLLEHFLHISRTDIVLEKTLETTQLEMDWDTILQRINAHEPIQYVLGEAFFLGRCFEVTTDVLIPRNETEELIIHVLEALPAQKEVTLLDIGTGSGCIAISLAAECKNASVWAFDVSEKALAVATKNAIANNVIVNFQEVDILRYKPDEKLPKFDGIVSNPPYVMEKERKTMQKNVLNYEPSLALFVEDNDPLIFYRVIANFAKKQLKKDGFLFFEINEALGNETADLLRTLNFKNVEILNDIHKKHRFVKGFF